MVGLRELIARRDARFRVSLLVVYATVLLAPPQFTLSATSPSHLNMTLSCRLRIFVLQVMQASSRPKFLRIRHGASMVRTRNLALGG